MILRVAAILILVHILGHSFGHMTWDTPEDPKLKEVVTAMKGYKADFMGANKSMGDYYNGYSLMIFVLFALGMVMLWMISGFVNEQRDIARKLLIPIGIAFIMFGVIEYLYFFPFAASMSFLAGVLTLLGAGAKR